MNLPGWKRISKSTDPVKHARRWYVNESTGEQLSRTAYQTLQAGGVSPFERAKIRRNSGIISKTSSYAEMARAYKRKQAVLQGVSEKKIKVRGNSESALLFKRAYHDLSKLTKAEQNDNSPGGKKAQILVSIGFRNPEWSVPVGESPKEGI